MKTRKYSKIMTLFLALAMIMAMSISTFAAGSGTDLGKDESINPNKSGVISNGGVREDGADVGGTDAGKYGVYTAVGNKVTLDKEIIIFNTRSTDTVVYLPNIKYEYAVTAVDVADGKYITDEYELKGAINDGVSEAAPTAKSFVEFSNTAGISGTGMTAITDKYVTTTSSGVAAKGTFDLQFDPSKFSKPGVYRYKVTETIADDYSRPLAGVTNTDYNADRYLDVYVQNAADGGYEIYGYVLFEDAKDTAFTADPGTPIKAKTNGFVSDKFDDGQTAYSKTEKSVDIYETSNVKIQKVITGTMADKTHEFPFEATLKNTTIKKNPIVCYVKVAKDGTETTTASSNPTTMTDGEGKIGAASADGGLKLKDGEFIYVYGVPGKEAASSTGTTTALVKEFNDTAEVYTVSATYNDTAKQVKTDTAAAADSVQMKASEKAEYNEAQTLQIASVQDVAVVTNKLNAISPTNVVMRFAPYLFILGGAMLLLFASRRRRSEQE